VPAFVPPRRAIGPPVATISTIATSSVEPLRGAFKFRVLVLRRLLSPRRQKVQVEIET
jgi:hypothetical protein